LGSLLCPNKANKPGYGQLYIYSSAEAAANQLENQSDLKESHLLGSGAV
jgi:hypothetical protein